MIWFSLANSMFSPLMIWFGSHIDGLFGSHIQILCFPFEGESKTVQNRNDTFLMTVNRYKII